MTTRKLDKKQWRTFFDGISKILEGKQAEIEVNVQALVALTHHFGEAMAARGKGGIINVASNASFQPLPYMATYAATKAFVLSFSEALREENRPYGIKVMALCPGVTDTNFFSAAQMQKPPRRIAQTPDQVVDTALRGLKRGKAHIISGWTNFFMIESERLVPRSLSARVAGTVLKKTLTEKE